VNLFWMLQGKSPCVGLSGGEWMLYYRNERQILLKY